MHQHRKEKKKKKKIIIIKKQTNTKNKFKISYYNEIKWEKNPQNVKPLQAQGRTT